MDLNDIERRMRGALGVFSQELGGLRTGRASGGLLDSIKVSSYGTEMPINQLGTVSVPEARLITVQVWDKSMIQAMEKAVRDSGLGLNPNADGDLIRIPIPELNEERREELSKVAGKFAEQARIAVRNVRRDGMEKLKQAQKVGEVSQDEQKRLADEIQILTDKVIGEIDTAYDRKSQEITQI